MGFADRGGESLWGLYVGNLQSTKVSTRAIGAECVFPKGLMPSPISMKKLWSAVASIGSVASLPHLTARHLCVGIWVTDILPLTGQRLRMVQQWASNGAAAPNIATHFKLDKTP